MNIVMLFSYPVLVPILFAAYRHTWHRTIQKKLLWSCGSFEELVDLTSLSWFSHVSLLLLHLLSIVYFCWELNIGILKCYIPARVKLLWLGGDVQKLLIALTVICTLLCHMNLQLALTMVSVNKRALIKRGNNISRPLCGDTKKGEQSGGAKALLAVSVQTAFLWKTAKSSTSKHNCSQSRESHSKFYTEKYFSGSKLEKVLYEMVATSTRFSCMGEGWQCFMYKILKSSLAEH